MKFFRPALWLLLALVFAIATLNFLMIPIVFSWLIALVFAALCLSAIGIAFEEMFRQHG